MKINCEHAISFSKFESIITRKSRRKNRQVGSTRTAVVIKEFSLEKRSLETHLVKREVGMWPNEWLLLGVLNYW